MFENPGLMDRFIQYWRETGYQRIGLLYGKYEHYKDVPLGIKATVAAIYEPPQVNSPASRKIFKANSPFSGSYINLWVNTLLQEQGWH